MILVFLVACAAEADDTPNSRRAHAGRDDSGTSTDTADTADTGDTAALPAINAETTLAALGDCAPLAGVTAFANNDGGKATVSMCTAPGVVWWTSDMDIDCDGGHAKACKDDPYYQPETSANDSHGDPLDASSLPFVVLPLDSNGYTMNGVDLHLGSVAAVIYDGKLAWAVVGDRGPGGAIGEGSYALAVELGIDPDPVSGGTDEKVRFVHFTGEDAVVVPIESHAAAVALGEAQAAALLAGKP